GHALVGFSAALAAEAEPAGEWVDLRVPGTWPAFDEQDGEAVFRLVLDLPESWAGRELTLSLGPIDDHDLTWFNGEQIAAGSGWNTPRSYRVPGRLVRAGRNVLAIRVFDDFGGGGFNHASPEQFNLQPVDRDATTVGYYHVDYRGDFAFGDSPYRYFRW
ncbi:MAG: hypothetical protein PF961_01880, partial [Planctomycetota bacterium]|nr:hypothetical protein [Planctomycetota bacterium]